MNGEHGHAAVCPLYHRAVELIGRRWTGAILRVLLDGETRFSDLTQSVPGLSDRLLSERLKELETEGIVTRTVFPEIPVRIEYTLTEKGRALGDVMDAIGTWAHRWLAPDQPADVPDVCSPSEIAHMREQSVARVGAIQS
jgi:DNA-binding HxlR family transcriptional regulator